MKLSQLYPQLGKDLLKHCGNLEIKGISCDSRSVSKDYIFVAIKGNKLDANQFIDQAIKNGANVIISDAESLSVSSRRAAVIKVKDARKALADISRDFYGSPSEKIKAIGITGTNGKTTVSYLLEGILKEAGLSSGVIGTINYRLKHKQISSTNTTPGPIEIQSLLAEMLKEKIKYCIMEVSSHSLDQKRVSGVDFEAAIFTNLTSEHLDYHLNLENYFSAKAKLFKGLKKTSWAIINLDDKYAQDLINITPARTLTYGISQKNSKIKAEDLRLAVNGAEFKLISEKGNALVKTNLLGRHNVYNILASVSLALTQDIDLGVIVGAIKKFKSVPGRLEEVKSNLGFRVFVDFAHTPDALKNVLNSLREFCRAKIIVVFGCGGDRDRIKRPLMGKIASEMADFSIITLDNPRSEAPQAIIDEIVPGIKSANYKVILDREEAIKQALSMAEKDDIVLIAGKGHEKTQIFKDRTIPFDDVKEVKKAIKCLA